MPDDKISPHFNRSEFACHCGCGYNTVDAELITVLENMRTYFEGSPIKINSGCRCVSYNAKIGGVERSQHRYGKAADIVVTGFSSAEVYVYLDLLYPDKYGIGLYNNFIHIDVRAKKARW